MEVGELTEDEGRAFFDSRCRALLGISAIDFFEAYDWNRHWELGTHEDVVQLITLIPFWQ